MHIINDTIDWLLSATQLDGFQIILLTLPLAIIQNFLGCFPFATLIVLHVSALGIVNGMIISWLVSIVASLVVYFCCRFWFADWFDRKMSRYETKYEKWKKIFQVYGVWAIILMRTLPIMPNNVIAFLSSIASIRPHAYLISSIIGNLSHIWLFGIISSSIVFPGTDVRVLLGSYIGFCVLLVVAFFIHMRMNKVAGSRS